MAGTGKEGENQSLMAQLVDLLKSGSQTLVDIANPVATLVKSFSKEAQIKILNMLEQYMCLQSLERSSEASARSSRAVIGAAQDVTDWTILNFRKYCLKHGKLNEYDTFVCARLGISRRGLIAFYAAIYDRLEQIITRTTAKTTYNSVRRLIDRIKNHHLPRKVERLHGSFVYAESMQLSNILRDQDGSLTRLARQLRPTDEVDNVFLTKLGSTISEILLYYKYDLREWFNWFRIPHEKPAAPTSAAHSPEAGGGGGGSGGTAAFASTSHVSEESGGRAAAFASAGTFFASSSAGTGGCGDTETSAASTDASTVDESDDPFHDIEEAAKKRAAKK